jgi:hydroxyethylthiazole kinase-like sugar kinase family protein
LIDIERVVAVTGQWDLAANIDRCYNDKEYNNDEMLHKIVATTKIGAL